MDRQLNEQTLHLAQQHISIPAPPPQRWQPDRRAARQIDGPPEDERRSGTDKRRQPRMPAGPRPIYSD